MNNISLNPNLVPPAFGIKSGKGDAGVSNGEVSFVDMLQNSVQKVDQLQKEADTAAKELAIGKADNIHDVAIAIEKADISFRFMVQVRNKMLEAYQEVMRTQM